MLAKSTIKWRIKRLQTTIGRMNSASSKLDTLTDSLSKLEDVVRNNLRINDDLPYKEYLEGSLTKAKNAKGSISGIVSGLYYRINKYKKQLAESEE